MFYNCPGFGKVFGSQLTGPFPAFKPVLRIRIRMDPELLPGSVSGIIVPDPAKSERADK